MKNHNAIHHVFTAWGSNERRLPPRHEELKNKILANVIPGSRENIASPLHLPWLSFAFTGLAVLTLLMSSGGIENTIPRMGMLSGEESSTESMPKPSAIAPIPQNGLERDYVSRPWPEPDLPITDPREFLKTDYHAVIRTRRVEELTRRIETTARGFDGRIDSVTSSPRFGFIAFAVPAGRFEAFKNELEGLVRPRFLRAEVRTENLLPQKRSLEGEKRQTEQTLSEFRADRQRIITDHSRRVSSLQSELNAIGSELALLDAEQTSDPARKAEIAARIQALLYNQDVLTARLAHENTSYGKRLDAMDRMIRDAEAGLKTVIAEDQRLMDTTATVRGTISLNWIRIGEVVQLYISLYGIASLFAGAAVASYLLHRHRSRIVLP